MRTDRSSSSDQMPDLDWVQLAQGMGVDGARATTAEELSRELARGLSEAGPYVIKAVL